MAYPNLTIGIIDSHKAPHIGFYTITPQVAAAVLTTRNGGNRHISPTKAMQATHDVANGNFVLNGETMIFSNEGKLLDGQHRLSAVVAGGKAIVSAVSLGMIPESADTVDQGKTRSARDVMARNGYANSNELGSVGRFLRGYYEGDGTNFGRVAEYSATEVIDWVDNNPRIHDIVAWAALLKHSAIGIVTATQMALARAILAPHYGDQHVTDFLERVAFGDNITKSHAAYTVRTKLTNERRLLAKERKRISNPVGVELLMRGYLAHYHKRSLTAMKTKNALPAINKTARAVRQNSYATSASSSAMAQAQAVL